jgi:acyl-CoA synthetase (AMP-forming)/AMP-acid ligase II
MAVEPARPVDDLPAPGKTLPDQLRLMAAAFPDEVAFRDVSVSPVGRAEMTFAEWDAQSNRLARWLVDHGVAHGDRVAVHVPPEEPAEFLIAYSAAHKAGAVAVPTSTRMVARELAYVLGHAGAVAAVTGRSSAATLAAARPDLPELREIVTTAPDLPDATAWAEVQATPDEPGFQVPIERDDLADLMYTSGTTGRPKGVVVRHRNVAMVPNGLPRWSGRGAWLHASPMFTFAGIASTYNPMKLGLRLMYLPRFDVDRWFDVVEQQRPTATFVVPAMAELLIASPRFDEVDLTSLTICSLGSAPVAPATIARLQERIPNALVSNSWGMTEAGPAFCFMPPEEHAKRIGSVGRPVEPVELRIVAPEDSALPHAGDPEHPLPAREIGELVVRNPGREREYFNDPEATASTWRDGWLHSGDLAYLDEDGFLYIVGRQKDVIIRGGNNVHAADVEAVLFEHPAVQEVAVAGVPHDVLGEDVAAWVVLAPGTSVAADELIAFTAERLADYKRPRQIVFVDALPRNATGKVVKRDLPGRESNG